MKRSHNICTLCTGWKSIVKNCTLVSTTNILAASSKKRLMGLLNHKKRDVEKLKRFAENSQQLEGSSMLRRNYILTIPREAALTMSVRSFDRVVKSEDYSRLRK